ncbi:hypothetical protein [Nostoc sp.]|uniref:hypothetical protein n=1 Tax=Nostoc sp. TaxID=1180 RepID=UPI002FF6D8ED
MQDLYLSYVIWQEEIDPFLVVELLLADIDEEYLGKRLAQVKRSPTKWEIYERILRIFTTLSISAMEIICVPFNLEGLATKQYIYQRTTYA